MDAEFLLRQRLAAGTGPGWSQGAPAHRHWAHRLSYGRHAGPAPWNHRAASVMVILARSPRHWFIPLIVRPSTMRAHAGQVALPGGSRQANENACQCAIRETSEEIGVDSTRYRIVGPLSPVYIYVSNFLVEPWLAIADEGLQFQPNPDEVSEILEFPCAELSNPKLRGEHTINRFGVDFLTPHLRWAERRIWGATSSILGEVQELLSTVNWPLS
ncbi:MAG: NUDIX hydrolase [Planctomycetota bacterium]